MRKGTSKLTRPSFLVLTLLLSSPIIACNNSPPCGPCAEASYAAQKPGDKGLPPKLQRFYDIDNLMNAAYKVGNLAKAKTLADEYLAMAAQYPCDWNYGNAIHDANAMLGLISLKAGNVDAATAYLLEAGKTPGSPQLDTFGPKLDLADALLKAGKVDAVKTYLNEIKSFWTMDNGNITRWLAAIDKGDRPRLDRFAVYIPHGPFIILSWIAFLWPTLITIVFLYVRRAHIIRKPLFILVGLICVYVSVLLVNLAALFGMRHITPSIVSSSAFLGIVGILIVIVWLLPVAILIVVSRFFRTKPNLGQ